MKLTSPKHWQYKKAISAATIDHVSLRDEWIKLALSILPQDEVEYLELGCAPGVYTAALSRNTRWLVSGIDYSEDSQMFINTLSLVGKEAKLYHQDLFDKDIGKRFGIVSSFGLVEHFRGSTFDVVMDIHDKYLLPKGYCIVVVPNFTGYPYLFHLIFDCPDMDLHNIDVMHPDTISDYFSRLGYDIVLKEYIGVMRLWGNSGFLHNKILAKLIAALAVGLSKVALFADKVGISLRGKAWSPWLMIIARKP